MYYEDVLETKEKKYPLLYRCNTVIAPKWETQFHWHEELEVVCFISGNAEVNCSKDHFYSNANEIIVMNPYELHKFSSDSGCARHLLFVGKKMLRNFGCENIRFSRHINDPEIVELFSNMQKEAKLGDAFSEEQQMALAVEILVKLCRRWSITEAESSTDKNELKHRMTIEIMEYIDHHFTEPINVGKICAALGYSKSYACRVFHEITGLTIAHQIATRRIYYAETLLSSKKYTVTECASMCGFSSASYFSKVYRNMYGKTPNCIFALPQQTMDN